MAFQVIRDYEGKVVAVYDIDLRYLRTDKERTVFFYSEHFGNKSSRQKQTLIYPSFVEGGTAESSVLFCPGESVGVYPAPLYAAAVKACETERSVDTFHLNAINNGFFGSYFVNFNNGVPTDQIKKEIAKDFEEKFCGSSNAARVAFSWNNTKDNATTLEKIDVDDFGEKYQSLAKHCRQQIFTAFRANPNLFGIPTESLGFSSEEYESAFKLFNRTTIKPAQKAVKAAYDRIFGITDSVAITPFTLED